jgi:hypothetical protein
MICSGYCVKNNNDCPVTSIQKITKPPLDHTYYFASNSAYYTYSKAEGRPIVSLLVSFEKQCANDYRYFDEYQREEDYWKSLSDCGEEGTIHSFFEKIDTMESTLFFQINAVDVIVNDPLFDQVILGSVFEINFEGEKDGKLDCEGARALAGETDSYLFSNPVEPQFTQGLLVISFVLLVVEVIWLLSYYCFFGYLKEKNLVVVMLCVI